MDRNESWPDNYNEEYCMYNNLNQDQLEKLRSSSKRGTKFKDILPWDIS